MAELTKEEEESNKVKEDWKFVAMVLDRSTCLHTHGLVVFFIIEININSLSDFSCGFFPSLLSLELLA